MDERIAQADPEVIRDLVQGASKDPQQVEAMLASLIEQAQDDQAVAKALAIATKAALLSTPRAR